MPTYELLLAPAANRVYADQTPRLAAAEAAVVGGWAVQPHRLAGARCLRFEAERVDPAALRRLSAGLALFEVVPDPAALDETPAERAAPAETVPDPAAPAEAVPDPATSDEIASDPAAPAGAVTGPAARAETVSDPTALDPVPPHPALPDQTQLGPAVLDQTPLDQAVPDLTTLRDSADLDRVLLRPLPWPALGPVEEDLVTIPKYAGKTNEQFTQLLLNVTLSQVQAAGPITVLDPMCGRGTTLTTAWRLGWDAAGVEIKSTEVEALAAFLKTYLRRKRLKHRAELSRVHRGGNHKRQKLEVEAQFGDQTRRLTVFSGDTRQSAALWGKRRFPAVVVDAPYGVVHGSHTGPAGPHRLAGELLAEAVPVWSRQLAPGGALGLSWNSLGLPRRNLIELVQSAGLIARQGGVWELFGHRVDSSIYRDIIVATKPLGST